MAYAITFYSELVICYRLKGIFYSDFSTYLQKPQAATMLGMAGKQQSQNLKSVLRYFLRAKELLRIVNVKLQLSKRLTNIAKRLRP